MPSFQKNILILTVPIADEFEGKLHPIMMDKTRSHPPTGVYLLARILKDRDIPFRFIDLIALGQIESELIDLEYQDADIIAIPANSLNWPTASRTIRRIRRISPEAIIILGNIHGTLFPEHILENHQVDYILRGEAENTFPALLECLSVGQNPANIPGICYKMDGRIYVSPEIPDLSEEELNQNPAPLWEIMPEEAYSSISIESSRGCPFNCAFCSIPFRRRWRKLSARRFVDVYKEVAPFVGRTRTNIVSITDDCFSIHKQRVHEIVSCLQADGLEPSFSFDARAPEICDDKLCEAVAPYTGAILIGAESGTAESLERIRKEITLEQITKAARNTQRYGIAQETVFSFILGFPWESYSDIMRTIDFAFELHARYGVQLYMQWHNLIPGSDIWSGFKNSQKLSIEEYDELGFFRNEKLMSLGHGCKKDEIFEICDQMLSLEHLANIKGIMDKRKTDAISFSVPWYLQKEYLEYSRNAKASMPEKVVAS